MRAPPLKVVSGGAVAEQQLLGKNATNNQNVSVAS